MHFDGNLGFLMKNNISTENFCFHWKMFLVSGALGDLKWFSFQLFTLFFLLLKKAGIFNWVKRKHYSNQLYSEPLVPLRIHWKKCMPKYWVATTLLSPSGADDTANGTKYSRRGVSGWPGNSLNLCYFLCHINS